MGQDELISTKIKIVECAVKLYKERGYSNVTVQDICDLSGITRSAFYYHFKSKDEILDNYFLYSDVLVAEKLFSILATENYLEQFFCLFEMYLARTLECGPEIFGQILKRNIEMGTNVLDPNEISMRKAYITLIKKAQESGQILNCSPASELVDAAVYIADGIALVWSSRKGTLDFIPEHRRILNALFMADNK